MNVLPLRCAGDRMSLLRLDFQQKNRIPPLGVGVLVLAVVVLVLAAVNFMNLNDQVESLESKASQAQNNGSRRGAPGRSPAFGGGDLAQEIGNANDVLRRLSVPWQELFRAVESAGGRQATLLGLEPDIERHQVKISGEAKNFKAIMNYIVQLEQQEVFGAVYLQSHEIQQKDPDKPVRFSLLATWKEIP